MGTGRLRKQGELCFRKDRFAGVVEVWLVWLVALTLIAQPFGTEDGTDHPDPSEGDMDVSATMRRAFDWQLSNLLEGLSPKHGWTRAVFYAGVMAAYEVTGDRDYLDAAAAWAEGEQWRLGPRARHADDHCCAQTYIDLWDLAHDPVMTAHVIETFDAMVAEPALGREEWSWCDALFMSAPALAQLSAATGDPSYIDLADDMWWDTTEALYDREESLFHRDARARLRAEESASGGVFWGRGNGWVAAGTARMLDHMPPDHPSRARYEELLRNMCARLAELQGPDGLWRADLLDESPGSGETSASALICCAMAWGVRSGLLDSSAYRPVVERAWAGLRARIDVSGRLGRVQQMASGPGPVRDAETAEFGAGALLLAGSEVLQLMRTGELRSPSPGPPRSKGAPAPGEAYTTVTEDGAWCWFAGPRAVCHERERRRTYLGWIGRTGDVNVASVDGETGAVETSTVGTIDWPNDHSSPSILVGDDGHVRVFYCGHAGWTMRYRCSAGPEDISAWSDERLIETNTEGYGGYSYPTPVLLAEDPERYFLFWRGGDFKPCFSTSRDAVAWADARSLLNIEGNRRRPRPYVRIASDGRRTMHIAFTNGHPEEETFNNVYYVCYRDGAFARADGTVIGSLETAALELSSCDLVYDACEGSAQGWIWDVAQDAWGRPVVAYATFPGDGEHQYWHASWDDGRWITRHITTAGRHFVQASENDSRFEPCYSGGLALDRADPRVVYVSRPVEGVFEIEKWVLSEDGSNWSSVPLTVGSARNNVRPCIPEGRAQWGPEALWMHGDYVHYADFHTDIRMMWPAALVTDAGRR